MLSNVNILKTKEYPQLIDMQSWTAHTARLLAQRSSPVEHVQLTWRTIANPTLMSVSGNAFIGIIILRHSIPRIFDMNRRYYLECFCSISLLLNYTYLIFQDLFCFTNCSLLVKRNTHSAAHFIRKF